MDDVGVDRVHVRWAEYGGGGPVAAQQVGCEPVVQEFGAPVVGVVVLAAVGVFEEEAVFGDTGWPKPAAKRHPKRAPLLSPLRWSRQAKTSAPALSA
ncbi:hypothetical protein ABZ299_19125 [Streptomyces sp. NPDC006184]|uniref:hypothetical protein n=1 Tax=Streptomyces sp. NPDC006184 TaxID=3155455 RepID=UPI0033AFDCE1